VSYFAKLPEAVLMHPHLSANAVRLYGVMQRRAGTRGWFYDSLPRLTECMHLAPSSTRTVRRAIAELEDIAAIRVDRTTKPNGHHGGNRYTVLDETVITGVDREAMTALLLNPWSSDQGTPGQSAPGPLVKQPSRPESPSEPPESPSTAASRPAPDDDTTTPSDASTRRDAYRHEAQWAPQGGETALDRAARVFARAWTLTNGVDLLPPVIQDIATTNYDDLTHSVDRDVHQAVHAVRDFNTNIAPGMEGTRLTDAELVDRISRALQAGALDDLSWFLEGIEVHR